MYVDGSQTESLIAKYQAEGIKFSNWGLDEVMNSSSFPNAEYQEQQVSVLTGTE
jgi:hypothetical protein